MKWKLNRNEWGNRGKKKNWERKDENGKLAHLEGLTSE
jgi:hypothetical protein